MLYIYIHIYISYTYIYSDIISPSISATPHSIKIPSDLSRISFEIAAPMRLRNGLADNFLAGLLFAYQKKCFEKKTDGGGISSQKMGVYFLNPR